MSDKGQDKDIQPLKSQEARTGFDDFVLDKSIFSNIFERDIRRVYIYKKAERLAKAIHLVAPAFRNSPALRDKMDLIAVGLVDAAILPPASARDALSRELLALSSVLSIARTGGLLSAMNAELIGREAHLLLQEVAGYEEPRLFLDDAPTLAMLAKDLAASERIPSPLVRAPSGLTVQSRMPVRSSVMGAEGVPGRNSANGAAVTPDKGQSKGQPISEKKEDRKEAILSVLRTKGPSYIKDVSMVIRDVSEKTIQRELQALIDSGKVTKEGERRWTTYAAV